MNSVWGNEIGFGIIISRMGRMIIRLLFLHIRTFTLCFVRASGPLAPTISQTSDVSKTSDVFPQGYRQLFQSNLTEKGDSRHRLSGRHPMSNHNEFRLGNEISFAIIISRVGRMIIRLLFLHIRTFTLCFVRASGPLAPTISQTSDVSKTSDVFPQGYRQLFQSNLTEQGDSRHRLSGRHPMSNSNESDLEKKSLLGL